MMLFRFSLLSLFLISMQVHAESPLIAVASNMSYAMEELIDLFEKKTGHVIRVSYGSSGNLSRQILQGAPYELFLSADDRYVRRLEEQGMTFAAPEPYAQGRLCLFVPIGSRFRQTESFDQIIKKVMYGQYNKMAMPNPALAPYGRATLTALQRSGIWATELKKIVIGENVSQTTQYIFSGTIDLGFIPYSHSLIKKVSARGHCHLLPEYLHDPIVQEMAIMKSAGTISKDLYAFLKTTEAKLILARYGYDPSSISARNTAQLSQ